MNDTSLPRHKFWGAGEPDCPPELKAPNGELHTSRCKVCGDGWRKSQDVCFGALGAEALRMTPEERHADVVRRYPGGIKPEQFRRETLASADADGKLDPPALADPWAAMSLLIGMYMEGLIERRGPGRASERTGPWFLTEAGRRAASS